MDYCCEKCGTSDAERITLMGLSPSWICVSCSREFALLPKTVQFCAELKSIHIHTERLHRLAWDDAEDTASPDYPIAREQANTEMAAIQHIVRWLGGEYDL